MAERVKDGGPAFPSRGGMLIYAPQEHEKEIREVIERMDRNHEGLTRREWFAGQALQGLISNGYFSDGLSDISVGNRRADKEARVCYAFADAMLRASEKGNDHE